MKQEAPRLNKSEILEDIRNQIGRDNLFEGNSFEEEECSADLSGVSEDDRVILDLDKMFPSGQYQQKQCECVIFYFDDAANLVVIPIELKGGKNAEAEKAVEQLEGGATYAARYITPIPPKYICYPVLFHSHISTAEIRQLKRNPPRVKFLEECFVMRTQFCGEKLADVLPKSV